MIELGKKYGFEIKMSETEISLIALNTDSEKVKWITYNIDTDIVHLLGNTDYCNLWFCDTRKDLSPDDCINFVVALNQALDVDFKVREIIDPEDWQEIAQIINAFNDNRYLL